MTRTAFDVGECVVHITDGPMSERKALAKYIKEMLEMIE